MRTAAVLAALAVFALAAPPGQAMDSSPAPRAQAAPDVLAAARTAVKAGRWDEALAELRRVNATGSADWNNLMGFALRRQAQPDLDGAEAHYRSALKIDPEHRGAHEYLGELQLMRGNLEAAQQSLAVLDRLCRLPCEEFTDLKKAIARYQANGNRYSGTP